MKVRKQHGGERYALPTLTSRAFARPPSIPPRAHRNTMPGGGGWASGGTGGAPPYLVHITYRSGPISLVPPTSRVSRPTSSPPWDFFSTPFLKE
ncbi:unnamed protein product [Dicrocoelium dendriticum]|nr:unnamed protein product [Dicrocoelium dendriticum]